MLEILIALIVGLFPAGKAATQEISNRLDSYSRVIYEKEKEEDRQKKERIKYIKEMRKKQKEEQEKKEEILTAVDVVCKEDVSTSIETSSEEYVEEPPVESTKCEDITVTEGTACVENCTSVYQPRYGELSYTEEDIFAMACVVQHESGCCSEECKRAVTCCIINRVLEPLFPQDTIMDIILAKDQFPGCEYYNHTYDYPSEDTYNVVRSVINDGIDYANEATLFYNGAYSEWHEWYRRVKDVDGMHFHARIYPA